MLAGLGVAWRSCNLEGILPSDVNPVDSRGGVSPEETHCCGFLTIAVRIIVGVLSYEVVNERARCEP